MATSKEISWETEYLLVQSRLGKIDHNFFPPRLPTKYDYLPIFLRTSKKAHRLRSKDPQCYNQNESHGWISSIFWIPMLQVRISNCGPHSGSRHRGLCDFPRSFKAKNTKLPHHSFFPRLLELTASYNVITVHCSYSYRNIRYTNRIQVIRSSLYSWSRVLLQKLAGTDLAFIELSTSLPCFEVSACRWGKKGGKEKMYITFQWCNLGTFCWKSSMLNLPPNHWRLWR